MKDTNECMICLLKHAEYRTTCCNTKEAPKIMCPTCMYKVYKCPWCRQSWSENGNRERYVKPYFPPYISASRLPPRASIPDLEVRSEAPQPSAPEPSSPQPSALRSEARRWEDQRLEARRLEARRPSACGDVRIVLFLLYLIVGIIAPIGILGLGAQSYEEAQRLDNLQSVSRPFTIQHEFQQMWMTLDQDHCFRTRRQGSLPRCHKAKQDFNVTQQCYRVRPNGRGRVCWTRPVITYYFKGYYHTSRCNITAAYRETRYHGHYDPPLPDQVYPPNQIIFKDGDSCYTRQQVQRKKYYYNIQASILFVVGVLITIVSGGIASIVCYPIICGPPTTCGPIICGPIICVPPTICASRPA